MVRLRSAVSRLTTLRHDPALALGVLAAAVVVGLAAAAGPLFVSSAEHAALATALADARPADRSVVTNTRTVPAADRLTAADDAMADEAARSSIIGPPERSLLSVPLTTSPPCVDAPNCPQDEIRFLWRDELFDHVAVEASAPIDDGVLLSPALLRQLGIDVGDELTISRGDMERRTRVAGTYAIPGMAAGALAADQDLSDVSGYWSGWEYLFLATKPPPLDVAPPPVALIGRDAFIELVGDVHGETDAEWSFPVAATPIDIGAASAVAAWTTDLHSRLIDRNTTVGAAFEAVQLRRSEFHAPSSRVLTALEQSREAGQRLSRATTPAAAAAQIIALVVLAGAGAVGVRMRRTQVLRSWAHGETPGHLGLQAATESAVPVLAGVVLGAFAAAAAVRAAGPAPDVAAAALRTGLRSSVLFGAVGLVLLAAVVAVAARGAMRISEPRTSSRLASVPWDLALLLLAALAWFEVTEEGASLAEAATGPLVTGFPFLAVAAAAALAIRLLAAGQPVLRRRRLTRLGVPAFLAIRRITSTAGAPLLMVGALAISIGLASYAVTAASSADASARLKATVSVGSDVAVRIAQPDTLDLSGVDRPSTHVVRRDARILGRNDRIELLQLDAGTFPAAVTWDAAFGLPSAEAVAAEVLDDPAAERVPVLIAGGSVPTEGEIVTPTYAFPYVVTGRLRTFPGSTPTQITVVVDRSAVTRAQDATDSSVPSRLVDQHEIWSKAEPPGLVRAIHEQSVQTFGVRTADEVRQRPSVLGASWTFDLVLGVGLGTLALALVALLLYLRLRQSDGQVANVLTARMGLSGRGRWTALALEVSLVAVAGAAVGVAAGVLTTALLIDVLDPLPSLQPAAALHVPVAPMVLGVGGLLVVGLVGATAVHLLANRMDPAKVLRRAN